MNLMMTNTTTQTTVAFEAGRTYQTRSVCDHNTIISITVASRTAKTIKTTDGKALRVSIYDGIEQVKPQGSYSMAPIVAANDTEHLLTDWERDAAKVSEAAEVVRGLIAGGLSRNEALLQVAKGTGLSSTLTYRLTQEVL